MTHYKQLLDTEWLGQWDFPPGREATVEIESVAGWAKDGDKPIKYRPARQRKVKGPDGLMRPEPVKRIPIRFKGKRKGWLAGPVSQEALRSMFGKDIENWVGKRITLYVDDDVMMGRKKVGGVRVRPVAATGPVTDDALDREVDEAVAEEIAAAFVEDGGGT